VIVLVILPLTSGPIQNSYKTVISFSYITGLSWLWFGDGRRRQERLSERPEASELAYGLLEIWLDYPFVADHKRNRRLQPVYPAVAKISTNWPLGGTDSGGCLIFKYLANGFIPRSRGLNFVFSVIGLIGSNYYCVIGSRYDT
jgi:hypothetical protein